VSQGDAKVEVESGEQSAETASLRDASIALPSSEDAIKCANGTSGDDGVVASGGGVKGAVDGSVVKPESAGGDTSCVSCA
jgi:hypothetical protein